MNELYMMNVPWIVEITYLKCIVSNKITYFELILCFDIISIYCEYCLYLFFLVQTSKSVFELLYKMTIIRFNEPNFFIQKSREGMFWAIC